MRTDATVARIVGVPVIVGMGAGLGLAAAVTGIAAMRFP